MEVTERDRKIFNFLFRVKYATVDQVSKYIGMTKRAAYRRLEILVNDKYLESRPVIGENRRFYTNGLLSRQEHDIESYRKKIKISRIDIYHHLKVIDKFIEFLELGIEEEDIYTEREIFASRIGIKIDKKKRLYKVPDLVIKRSDDKLIAIEIELTKKNNERLEAVMINYDRNTKYYAVRYLCVDEAGKRKVKRAVEKKRLKYVQVYTLDEFTIDLI